MKRLVVTLVLTLISLPIVDKVSTRKTPAQPAGGPLRIVILPVAIPTTRSPGQGG